jgi:hypothetical protein
VTLTITGKDQAMDAAVSDWKESAGETSFTLAFDVSLAKSGLKPPAAMAGMIKVRDVVHVKVDVRLNH